MFNAQFAINDQGTKAVNEAVAGAFASCQQSNALAPPPPCPAELRDYLDSWADGTVKWGATDLTGIKQNFFDPYRMNVTVIGEASTQFTAQTRNGGVQQGTAKTFLSGNVDLTKTPPTLSVR